MNQIWQITLDDYLNICKIAQELGRKPGDSMEDILKLYMEKKGIKPAGMTELTTDELIKEYASHGKNVLSIETKEDGTQKFKVTKLDKPENDVV